MTMSKEDFRVDLEGGKYTYIRYSDGNQKVLRHGEPWGRDVTGDNLVAAMGYRIEDLQNEVAQLKAEVAKLRGVV